MRRMVCIGILIIAASAAGAGADGAARPYSLGMGGGLAAPLGDSMETLEQGFAWEGTLGYRLNRRLQVGVLYALDGIGLPDARTATAGTRTDYGQARLGSYLRGYVTSGARSIYGKLVLANCHVTSSIATDPAAKSLPERDLADDYLSASAGVGLKVTGRSDTSLYVDAAYSRFFTDNGDGQFFTVTLGVDLDFAF